MRRREGGLQRRTSGAQMVLQRALRVASRRAEIGVIQ
jgi:hypothetical protein